MLLHTPCCSRKWHLGLRRTFPSTSPCVPYGVQPPAPSPPFLSPKPGMGWCDEEVSPTAKKTLAIDMWATNQVRRSVLNRSKYIKSPIELQITTFGYSSYKVDASRAHQVFTETFDANSGVKCFHPPLRMFPMNDPCPSLDSISPKQELSLRQADI